MRSRALRRILAGLALTCTAAWSGGARAADPDTGSAARAALKADPPEDPKERARADMLEYFHSEQREALVFLAFGAASMGAGGALISRSDTFPRSTGITLASVGTIQVVSSIVYYFAVNGRITRVGARLDEDPVAFKREELERIQGVSDRFVILRFTEAAVILAGAVVAAVGEVRDKPLPVLTGVGLGFAIEAATYLGLDFLAEARAHDYAARLRAFPASPRAFVAPVLSLRGDTATGWAGGIGGSPPIVTGAVFGLSGQLW